MGRGCSSARCCLSLQKGGTGELSASEMASALAGESREAAAVSSREGGCRQSGGCTRQHAGAVCPLAGGHCCSCPKRSLSNQGPPSSGSLNSHADRTPPLALPPLLRRSTTRMPWMPPRWRATPSQTELSWRERPGPGIPPAYEQAPECTIDWLFKHWCCESAVCSGRCPPSAV